MYEQMLLIANNVLGCFHWSLFYCVYVEKRMQECNQSNGVRFIAIRFLHFFPHQTVSDLQSKTPWSQKNNARFIAIDEHPTKSTETLQRRTFTQTKFTISESQQACESC